MPSYVALPATPDDLPQVASLVFIANTNDPVFTTIHPRGVTLSSLQSMTAQLEQMMDEDPSAYMMIVKDASSGECVGYGFWHFHVRAGLEALHDEAGRHSIPAEADAQAASELLSRSESKRREVLTEVMAGREGREGYAYLSALGTHPSHQRHGAASKIVEWGVERADDKDLTVYVESTPAAVKLYQKFGFQVYDKLDIDMSAGSGQSLQHTCMIRLPNAA